MKRTSAAASRDAGERPAAGATPPLKAELADLTPSSRRPSVQRPSRWRQLAKAAALLLLVVAVWMGTFRWLRRAPLWQWQHDLLAVDSPTDDSEPAPDALVVLGYCVDHWRGEVTAPLESRLRRAAEEACARNIGAVVLSGGSSPRIPVGLPTEAEIMATAFERLWMQTPCARPADSTVAASTTVTPTAAASSRRPPPRLILEQSSTSTLENARYTLGILLRTEPTLRRIGIVTNRFHQRRALATFRRIEKNRREEVEAIRAKRQQGEQAADTNQNGATASAARPAERTLDERQLLLSQANEAAQFDFSVTSMPLSQSVEIPQLDFWRELAATALYAMQGSL